MNDLAAIVLAAVFFPSHAYKLLVELNGKPLIRHSLACAGP